MRSFLTFIFLTGFYLFPGSSVLALEEKHWQLNRAVNLPEWLSITGEHRIRYEFLNNQFRSRSVGSDQILSLRTLVQTDLRFSKTFEIHLELQDARAELADEGSRMNSSIVNSAELLEANLVWKVNNLFSEGSQSTFRGGRLTMDIGKRRFIARNRFRNVIQGYTGIDWNWVAKDKTQVRSILTMPVNREPSAVADLLGNDVTFDEENLNNILWGIFVSTPHLPGENKGELYFFGLHEDDGSNVKTRNREVYTPGFRIYRPAKKGRLDYELESMFQFGTVRATTAVSDTTDLDHSAYFHHFEAGYTFEAGWSPRLYFEYDYASGDDDPNDGSNERFERLFGPNVTEYGPTSIHTAFVRANIRSPGIRLEVKPSRNLFAYLSYRAYWLASDRDGWEGASGLRDTTGNSGSFLGHQLFVRAKWNVHSNFKFEGGFACRMDGEFQKNVANSPKAANTIYTYTSLTLTF